MMRSMFSGVSGLRVHQTKMDVIANNIANVNTAGYKSSRVTFNEVFSQTVGGASQANPVTGRGGVNPMQIGLGANVSSIDKLMTTGAAQRTDNPFDVMIQGDGFFIVGDSSGNYFTRAGALNIDEDGNLVNGSGLKVMGWDAVFNVNTGQYEVQKGNVKPITIMGDKEYVLPSTTKNIAFKGNLNPDTDPVRINTMDFFDSVGNRYTVDVKYEYNPATATSDANWTYSIGDLAYPNGDHTKPAVGISFTFDANDQPILKIEDKVPLPLPTDVVWTDIATMKFSEQGILEYAIPIGATPPTVVADYTTSIKLFFDTTNAATSLTPNAVFGDANSAINLNFFEIRQFANESANAKAVKVDGNKPGTLVGVNIGTDGKITGRYSNGELRLLGQIPVAKFANPAGLEKVGDNLFVATANSGEFDGIGEEVQSGGGKMMGGVLEMSNVDLSAEFTEMITTQRGFQANSRIITVSDDMLQELVNLKR